MKTLKRIAIILISLCLIGIISAWIYYISVTKNVRLDPEKLALSESNLTLFDSEKKIILLGTEARNQTVPVDDVPYHTKQAFIDVEDKRFYRHNGFDTVGIARAIFHNIKAHSFKEGASTISQQLIKNSHLSQEKTLKRKLQEWKLTRQLEEKYTKDEILAMYLNSIYFGHSCFGIEAASEFYFGKETAQLTLAESATLAGMIKAPNNYSPFRHPEKCLTRRNLVLKIMQQNDNISLTEANAAMQSPLTVCEKKERLGNSYAHYVLDELTQIAEENDFRLGGKIEIQTFMDKNLQNYMQELAAAHTNSDKIFLSLDLESGGYKACVSTVDDIQRLPGSLLKPLLVYAPALEEDFIAPATPILDEKIDYSGYSPQNHDGIYHGYISARECVEKSLNVPAVKILSSVGLSKCVNYLQKLDLSVADEDMSLSLALGGMKHGYTLPELLSAYSVFPNGGVKQKSGFIGEIKINGQRVYIKPQSTRHVFSEESAYLMTDMLKSTAQQGTARKLKNLPFDVAAKTGTVGNKNGNTDAYAISYTSKDCLGVWLGNADNTKIEYSGGGLPCNYLKLLNEFLYGEYQKNDNTISPFKQPKNVVKISLDKPMYYDTHTMLIADENAPAEFRFEELFKKGAIPLRQSTSFTSPTIPTPIIKLEDNKVIIQLDPRSPTYYSYKIERSDYVTHTTIYEGGYTPFIVDENLEENKSYLYTITPIYKNKPGKKISLPSISTSTKIPIQLEDKLILDTDWWTN